MVLPLWIFYFFLSCICYAFVRVCLYVPCGHLLGKGCPLGSDLWCLTVSLLLSHWYLGSGVVLYCIDSWSLHPYLLWIWSQLVINPTIPLFNHLVRNEHSKKLMDTFTSVIWNRYSDTFTILGLWVLGLAVSLINESNCKLMSPEHYF